MKQRWVILATIAMMVLCVLTLGLLSTPSSLLAPSEPERAEPPIKLLADMTPDTPSTTPAPSATSPAPPVSPTPVAAPVTAPAAEIAPAQTEGGVVEGPEGCVLLGAPYRVAFLAEHDLTLMNSRGGVYAFEAASGRLIWYRQIESQRMGHGFTMATQHVVAWAGANVKLLDVATGRETWSRSNNTDEEIEWALLSADESRIIVSTRNQFIIYPMNNAERRVFPRPEQSWAAYWLSDNRTLVTVERKAEGKETPRTWKLLDTDTGEATGTWESPQTKDFVSHASKQGQFIEKSEDNAKNPTVKVRDVRTGDVVREFGVPEPVASATWLSDGKRFTALAGNRRTVRVIDSETGNVEFSLSKEGHYFVSNWAFDASPDADEAISQDDANNRYAWPMKADGTPRKVLSGRGIAAGNYYFHEPATDYVMMDRALEEHLWLHVAFSLEDQRTLAEWRVRGEEEWFYDSLVSRNLTRLVRYYAKDPEGEGAGWNPRNTAFSVYARNSETAVFSGEGRPIAISPDGRYVAVQSGDAAASLYDLDTGLAVQEYHGPPDREGEVYFAVAFSEDGRRVMTRGAQLMEITELIEGYPRRTVDVKEGDRLGWSVAFSPDSSRILVGGERKAWLFDADTGTQLRTFEEPERFAQRYGQGFWNGIAARASDWMGTVTDRFKSGTYVETAFAEHGSRVITYAAGQIIRVWDAESGALIRTIRTGLPEQRNKRGNIESNIVLSPNAGYAFSYSMNGYGVASLWSLSDGALLRQYKLPTWDEAWPQAMILDNGSAVYMAVFDNLYRWPGIASGS